VTTAGSRVRPLGCGIGIGIGSGGTAMRKAWTWAVVAGLAGGCSAPVPPAPPPAVAAPAGPVPPATAPPGSLPAFLAAPATPLADAGGYGPLRLGMAEAELHAAWGGPLAGDGPAADGCLRLAPTWAGLPPALAFVVEAGHFVRYEVADAREPAPGGGRVGMAVVALRARYPQAQWIADPAGTGAARLRVPGRGPDDGTLVFEVGADGRVAGWRVGLVPQVDARSGCD
jgi:hypothetical protein